MLERGRHPLDHRETGPAGRIRPLSRSAAPREGRGWGRGEGRHSRAKGTRGPHDAFQLHLMATDTDSEKTGAAGPPEGAVVTTGAIAVARPGTTPPGGAKPVGAAPAAKGPQPVSPTGPAPWNITRRTFFSSLGVAWLAFSGAMSAALTAMTRFMFPNVLFEPPMSFKAGYPSDYAMGVDERYKEKFGVWMVRNEEGIYALSTTCTHLGCTPNWLSGENKFKCPCHGSGFYPSGINFEGPAPRPLERHKISLGDDGQIVVDKNVKYQQEKGQWEDPGASLRYTG